MSEMFFESTPNGGGNAFYDMWNDPLEDHGETGTVAPVSSTVLDLDRWAVRRGEEISQEWAMTPELDGTPANIAADAHASLFSPSVRMADNPEDGKRAEWWSQLMETPEFASLRRQTVLDDWMSELASRAICDQWYEYADSTEDQEEGEPGEGDGEPIANTIARITSTDKAVKDAKEAVEDAKGMAAGLGLGAGGSVDRDRMADCYRRMRQSPQLKRILEMAGRMRTKAAALQRRKAVHGRDDTVGVEPGGDVARLLPSELALTDCGVDDLELLALYRIATRSAMCREYRGIEHVGRGPIVIVVDESGSMAGDRITAAKGLALALGWVASKQNRWVAYVSFCNQQEDSRELVIPPGEDRADELMDWLEKFHAGGTSPYVPLQVLPSVYWNRWKVWGMPPGRTDIITITDAILSCGDDIVQDYNKWKELEQVRSYGIIIGFDDAGDIGRTMDRYWCLPSLDIESTAVESVLSV